MTGPSARHDIGEGPLGRVTGGVYWVLVIQVLFLLTTAPGMLVLLLLERAASNAPLVALCLAPVGPAVSAAMFAWRAREREDDRAPAAHFWRGYRLNAVDVLRLWVPALLVLALIAFTLANLGAADVPSGYGILLVVVAAGVLLWALHALTIASFFAFRLRDVARLAAYYLARLPLVTLGVLSLLICAAGVVYLTFDAVVVLVGAVFALLLLRNAGPLLRDVEERFTA